MILLWSSQNGRSLDVVGHGPLVKKDHRTANSQQLNCRDSYCTLCAIATFFSAYTNYPKKLGGKRDSKEGHQGVNFLKRKELSFEFL